MKRLRATIAVLCLVLASAPMRGQETPAAAEAALGMRLQLSGQVMQQDPAGQGFQSWANDTGHLTVVRLIDASGEVHRAAVAEARGGVLRLEVPAPSADILLPVADYTADIVTMFAESFFGPIPIRPQVSNHGARVQRFVRVDVRTADDDPAGIIQRWREAPSSTMQMSWLYADRDVTIAARATAPGVAGEVDLRLREGWNRVVMTLVYERGREGRFVLRTAAQPSDMRWIYWEFGS